MSSAALLSAVREFTTTIANPYDLRDLLDRPVRNAIAVTYADGAGVMLAGQEGLGFASASDEEVVEATVQIRTVAAGLAPGRGHLPPARRRSP